MLEYGPGTIYAGLISSLGSAVGGQSYSNFLGDTATWLANINFQAQIGSHNPKTWLEDKQTSYSILMFVLLLTMFVLIIIIDMVIAATIVFVLIPLMTMVIMMMVNIFLLFGWRALGGLEGFLPSL